MLARLPGDRHFGNDVDERLELVEERVGGFDPRGRVFVEASEDDLLELPRDLRAQGAWRLRIFSRDALHHAASSQSGEGELTGQKLVEDDAGREGESYLKAVQQYYSFRY